MKITKLVLLAATSALFIACGNGDKTSGSTELKTKKDSTSYALGSTQAESFWSQMDRFETTEFINKDKFLRGLDDAISNAPKISNEEAMGLIRATLQKLRMDSTFQMPKISKGDELLNLNDSFGYGLGVNVATGLVNAIDDFKLQDDVNIDLIVEGMKDVATDMSKIDAQTGSRMVNELLEKASEQKAAAEAKEFEGNKEAGEKFLEENKKRSEVKVTESGLQYEVLKKGTGAQPSETDKVTVHYHGTLIDGTVFDSSVERGEPTSFPLNRVIPGWTEGVQLMKEGAKYKFYVPQELAYGSSAPQGTSIKPYSALIFEVELLEIEK
ncbi:MAG: FKBP-type peptidyl-prolyl cis-trans isomerase [Salinivirgaceae bacterium]|jgi:FKBP-type peptidyl-prolyl cis-trans isomerase|nr:FKBP-type peptidyl-prolyl cis-trans isomerase [Salinivirgaceae bacterium]